MAIEYRASINTTDSTGKIVRYQGQGLTLTAASNEANAKFNVASVDTVDSYTETKVYTDTDVPFAPAHTDKFDDAVFVGSRGKERVSIPVRNVSISYKNNTTAGSRDRTIKNVADTQAVVTAHTDAEGAGGFVFDHAAFNE